RRTDIWAFGCVLYEMLSGRRSFDGEDATEVLSRVLQREPDWTLLPAHVPPRLREGLGRCLGKNPRNRLRDAGDLRIDLESEIRSDAETGSRTKLRAPRVAAALALIALVAVALLTFAVIERRQAAPTPTKMVIDVTTPPTPTPLELALSPDGMNLAFVAPDV